LVTIFAAATATTTINVKLTGIFIYYLVELDVVPFISLSVLLQNLHVALILSPSTLKSENPNSTTVGQVPAEAAISLLRHEQILIPDFRLFGILVCR
jgi:hypothetical protein